MANDRVKGAMGGSPKPKKSKPKKGKKKASKIKAMHIRRMTGDDNPAFSITHDQHPGADGQVPEPEEHAAGDEQELLDHIQQHAPNIGPAETPQPMPAQPMPQ
jgi:hypothetical protein